MNSLPQEQKWSFYKGAAEDLARSFVEQKG